MTEMPDLALDKASNKASAAAALTPQARQLHRWVLTTFIETGRAPRRAQTQRTACDQGIDPDLVLSELVARDVLAVDEQGEIRAAYPFSPVPTRHRVTWAGSGGGYAMCAIDALGISAMLGRPVTITSTEPGTGHTITVRVDRDTAHWQPGTAVVFAGHAEGSDAACCPSVDRSCSHINFFTTPDAARDWATNNPGVPGIVLDQNHALANGIAQFGTLLHDTPAEG